MHIRPALKYLQASALVRVGGPSRNESTMTHASHQDNPLPYAQRRAEDTPGHWLLARLGKRVLRPGGLELTRKLLKHAGLSDADVVELAPGLGRTATELLSFQPASYVGVEKDEDAARITGEIVKDT